MYKITSRISSDHSSTGIVCTDTQDVGCEQGGVVAVDGDLELEQKHTQEKRAERDLADLICAINSTNFI